MYSACIGDMQCMYRREYREWAATCERRERSSRKAEVLEVVFSVMSGEHNSFLSVLS